MNDSTENNEINEKEKIVFPSVVKVSDLANMLDQPVTGIIRQLLKSGVLATINDSIDFETAAILADDFGFEAIEDTATHEEVIIEADSEGGDLKERPPIVTVMGHVDHGKTSLLDYIRKTKVADKESGGITQHISSYQVDYKGKQITFLDTPGHEAFSAIRAQGTKVTDVVVLVVAADEGVKPQTVEAIKLSQAAGVPIIVAVTKIDRSSTEGNFDQLKQQLGEYNVLTEAWGGKTPLVGVSSKTGEGVDELLELVSLTSEMAELKANYEGKARGIVLEARRDVKVGQLATVIIRSGKLIIGNNFVVGDVYGKVKSLLDYNGKRVKEAYPSMPVQITGFSGEPQVGNVLVVVENEKEARGSAVKNRVSSAKYMTTTKSALDALTDQIKSQKVKSINIILKTDVQGSLQAIKSQLEKVKTNNGGNIAIIGEGVGHISESDVLSAHGGKAFVVGFKVKVLPSAAKAAEKNGIKALTYDIIYELTDDLTNLLLEAVGSQRQESIEAEGEALKIFHSTSKAKIIGVKLKKGEVKKGYLFRAYRDDKLIGEGPITSIKHVADEIEVASKGDFGFSVDIGPKVKKGDRIEFVKVEHIKAKLVE